MFETNTGSCGGFPGISNVFGSALWVADYGMRLASVGFDSALLHIGGQNVYYNVRRIAAPSSEQTLIVTIIAIHSPSDEPNWVQSVDRRPSLLLCHCSCRNFWKVQPISDRRPWSKWR